MNRYADYDHPQWVQRQIDSYRKRKPDATERKRAADQMGWFAAPIELNGFHKRAFMLLGIVGNGIYNCPINWKTIHWWHNQLILQWYNGHGFGTWDFNHLTEFTMLCHMGRIRGYIGPGKGRGYLEICLSERNADRAAGMAVCHPNLDEAIDGFLSWYPAVFPELTYPGDPPPRMKRIREAVTAYHHALDKREHGGVAAGHLVDEIETIMGMKWTQGATLELQAVKADATS